MSFILAGNLVILESDYNRNSRSGVNCSYSMDGVIIQSVVQYGMWHNRRNHNTYVLWFLSMLVLVEQDFSCYFISADKKNRALSILIRVHLISTDLLAWLHGFQVFTIRIHLPKVKQFTKYVYPSLHLSSPGYRVINISPMLAANELAKSSVHPLTKGNLLTIWDQLNFTTIHKPGYIFFSIWRKLTLSDLWVPTKSIWFIYWLWATCIPSKRIIHICPAELTWPHGFQCFTHADFKWPLT